MTAAAQKRIHALLIASLLFGFYTILASRLLLLQVSAADVHTAEQKKRIVRSDHRIGKSLFERGRRGTILDRNQNVLAAGYQSLRLFVDPNAEYKPKPKDPVLSLAERAEYLLESLEEAGVSLTTEQKVEIFERVTTTTWKKDDAIDIAGEDDPAEAADPLSPKPRNIRSRFLLDGITTLQRRSLVAAMQKKRINNFFFQVATNRTYPEGALVGEIVGFVGGGDVSFDPIGQAGIESSLEQLLAGYPGKYVCEKDGHSAEYDVDGHWIEEPKDGCDVTLTIDLRIQRVLYDALRDLYVDFRKRSDRLVVCGVVLDTQTNEILAMKNFPDYSPEEVKTAAKGKFDMNRTLVHSVASSWEPGSTLKPFLAARYIEAGIVHWDDRFDTCNGTRVFKYQGHSRPLSDAHRNGVLSFTEIITKSSNIGMAIVGFEHWGFDKIYRAVDSYSFRERLQTSLPREVGGYYLPKKDALPLYTGVDLTYGHAIQMPPLELAAKYQIFGTGGTYMPAALVKAIDDGEEVTSDDRKAVRYLPAGIAEQVKEALVETVRTGTAKNLDDLPWTSLAKTGTAQVLAPVAERGSYNSSMIAMAPAQKPRITVLVFAHAVRGGTYFGASVAGPAVRKVLEQSLRILNVPEDKPLPTTENAK